MALAPALHKHAGSTVSGLTAQKYKTNIGRILDVAVPLIGGMRAHIHVGMNESLTQQQIRTTRYWILGASLLFTLIGIVIGVFGSQHITQPLLNLSRSMRSFGDGKKQNKISIKKGEKEVADLTNSFNQMLLSRNEMETSIIESEARYRNVFNSVVDGLVVCVDRRGGLIIDVNSAYEQIVGYSRDELIGRVAADMVPSDHQNDVSDFRRQLYRKNHAHKESLNLHSDGRLIPVEATGSLITYSGLSAILVSVRDISKRKQKEMERERLMSAIEQSSEIIVITNTNGIIQYVNPAFEKITGYTREEAVGQNPRLLKSGRQSDEFYEKMWSRLLQGESWKGYLYNKKKDGSFYREKATISPVKNKAGQIINFVAVKRDVTKELSLEKQLRQAVKMEAVGTLAGGIAHDFNNILTGILGYAELAKMQLSADDTIRKDLDQVIKGGHRAADLVKQILTFSRQGEEEFGLLKVQHIIKEVLKLSRASLPTTIQLKENIDKTCGPILADPTQVHQILMNLCTNAKHAIGGKQGAISISLSEVVVSDTNPIVDCPQIESGSYIDLEISDTGCGMDGITQSRIFDPFFSTKGKDEGTGLGLAVVHGIVKQHHGEITVASEPGKGTTFHVYLPIIDEEMQADLGTIEEIPRGTERILLVDDEIIIIQFMQQLLRKLGYTVTSFTSSLEALGAYKNNPEGFDLVITDMTMPEMTGTVLAGKLLAIRSDLPIILFSGYSETVDEETAKAVGIREYLMKPVINHTLATAIKRALLPS